MELNISKASYDGKWFDYGTTGARVQIRPYPASRANYAFKRDGVMVLSGEQNLDKFSYCFIGWEGFGDEGKTIPLTDETKRKVFDFGLGKTMIDGEEMTLSQFVIREADRLTAEIGELEKN